MYIFFLEASIIEKVKQEIIDFFRCNRGIASVAVVWDTYKAYIRVILIAAKAFREQQSGWVRVELVCKIQEVGHGAKAKLHIGRGMEISRNL